MVSFLINRLKKYHRSKCSKANYFVYVIILLSILYCNSLHAAENLTFEHYIYKAIAAGTFHTETFNITTLHNYAILKKVEAQFTYIAYNGYEKYVSARINKGSPPGSSGGASLVTLGSLPPSPIGAERIYGYKSFNNWNGQSANDTYYIRFATANGCPAPGPTINRVRLRLTYSIVNPDLVGERAYMSSISDPDKELTQPKVGDVVYFNFQFRLNKSDVSDAFKITCFLDNSLFYSTTYQNGASIGRYYPSTQTVSKTWTVTAGYHSIRWVVDADNQITESSETNNEATKSWTIAEQFDLVRGKISIKDANGNPHSGYVGETVYFHFDYRVNGEGSTPPFDIRCELDGIHYWTQFNVSRSGDQKYSVKAPLGFVVTEGSHTVKWILDANNEINESNETNNISTDGWTPTINLPDLKASADLDIDNVYNAGQAGVQVPVTIKRSQGNLTQGNYVHAKLYWSTDSIWDSGDTVLWSSNDSKPDFPNSILNSSGSKTVNATIDIPSDASGINHIIAYADAPQPEIGYPNGYHNESNENNNYTAYTVTISEVSSAPVFVPLYRLYNGNIHDHYYTTIPEHRDDYVQNRDYTYEKIECYISDRPFDHPNSGPLYHLWDKTNDIHFYTADENERTLKINNGFSDEGPVGYVYTATVEGMFPLAYAEHVADTDHFYTVSKFEYDNAANTLGFTKKGNIAYVSPTGLEQPSAHYRPQANYGGVDLGSGAYRGLNSTDLVLGGRGPSLSFGHYYNSFNFGRHPMGQGWSHSLYSHIIEDVSESSGKVYVTWGNGTVSEFNKTGGGPSDYVDETGNHDILMRIDDPVNYGYNLTRKNQMIYKYRRFDVYPYGKDRIVLLSIEDWAGNKLTFNYEDVTEISDGMGRMLRLSYYYPLGQLQKVEEIADGIVKRSLNFTYNDHGLLESFTDASGKTTLYSYYDDEVNARHNLLKSITYPEGNTVKIDYEGKMVRSIQSGNEANPPVSKISYSSADNTTTVEDPRGNLYKYNHIGYRLTEFSGPDLNELAFSYDDPLNPNKPTKIVDMEENPTYFNYDGKGNVTQIKNAAGKRSIFSYNDKNNLTTRTEFYASGATVTPTIYSYDSNGNRLRSIQNPENETTWLYYNDVDFQNQLTSIKDPLNHSISFSYDQYGNLEQVTDAEGNVTQYVKDYAGRTIHIIDAKNKNTYYSHDEGDNLTLVKNHLNHQVNLIYNDNGFLKNVNWINSGVSSSTKYAYDNLDRLKTITNPLSIISSFTYDQSSNLETKTDYNGNTITYGYDSNNRLESLAYPDPTISIGRNKNGSITSMDSPEGTSSFEYNALNLVRKYTGPYGNIVQYEYNDAGRLWKLTYPGGNVVTYGYDKAGRLKTVKDWIGGTTTYNYDDAGNLTQIIRPNGSKAFYVYDDSNRLTGISEEKSDGTIICSYSYDLDSVGNHLSVTATEPITASPAPTNISYTTDKKSNRLLNAGSVTYTYDNNGNRKTSFANGGMTYSWDYENMLVSVVQNTPAKTIQYKYDGMGNRIQRSNDGDVTRYVLDLSGNMSWVLSETDENGNIKAYYIYGIGLVSRIDAGGNRSLYHFNNRGDVIAITDEGESITDSYVYDEYGKLLDSAGTTDNPFKFVGKYGVMDEGDNLYFMRARFYDAEVGRFLSEDPLGFEGGDWNLYSYVRENPIIKIDHRGTQDTLLNTYEAATRKYFSTRALIEAGIESSIETWAPKWFSNIVGKASYVLAFFAPIESSPDTNVDEDIKWGLENKETLEAIPEPFNLDIFKIYPVGEPRIK